MTVQLIMSDKVVCKNENCGRDAVFVLKHGTKHRSVHNKRYLVCQRHGPRNWKDPSILLTLGSRVKDKHGNYMVDKDGYFIVVCGLEHILRRIKRKVRRKKGEKLCFVCGEWKKIEVSVHDSETDTFKRYCIDCME
jgi:hypothetical protein